MICRRDFESYETYCEAQGQKARRSRHALVNSLPVQVRRFTALFREAQPELRPGPVLCLGARTGAEVFAAEACGFAGSVGIDLHPLHPDVRRGDWHAMPEFSDGSFPNVYTNSFDHCLKLEVACAEIRRILSADGVFYLMASDRGLKDAAEARRWQQRPHSEALFWSHSDELRDLVVACGFQTRKAWRSGCWGHYILGRL